MYNIFIIPVYMVVVPMCVQGGIETLYELKRALVEPLPFRMLQPNP